jgi:hypothetical protein
MKLKALDRIKPGRAEVAANPRSRSAIMRVASARRCRHDAAEPGAAAGGAGQCAVPGAHAVRSRRLFTELDRAKPRRAAWRPSTSACRLKSARRPRRCGWKAGAGPVADAHGHAGHHPVYVTMDAALPAAARPARTAVRQRRSPPGVPAMSRSVLYTSSPLLASKTPVWRSKFIVAA